MFLNIYLDLFSGLLGVGGNDVHFGFAFRCDIMYTFYFRDHSLMSERGEPYSSRLACWL